MTNLGPHQQPQGAASAALLGSCTAGEQRPNEADDLSSKGSLINIQDLACLSLDCSDNV